MSAADRTRVDAERAAGPAEALSALEEALRQALASLPRDRVVKCLATTLPAEVLIDESARLHGKVRKVSVSMPEELADAVRARTGAGGFSRYVTDYVQVDEKLVEQARRAWPDHEEE